MVSSGPNANRHVWYHLMNIHVWFVHGIKVKQKKTSIYKFLYLNKTMLVVYVTE